MSFIPLYNIAKIKNNKSLPKIAVVINNQDPKGLGRIKVSLKGIFDATDSSGSNLPWIRRLNSEMGIGIEEMNVPAVGDNVEIVWLYDNKHAFYRGVPFGTSNKLGNFSSYDWGWATDSGFAFKVDKTIGKVTIETRGGSITMDSGGNITINGGNITITGNTKIDGKAFLSHKHSNGNQGSNTGGVV